jgi:hypothetical protein
MKTVAETTVKFFSATGECSAELEAALSELTKIFQYHAHQVAEQFGLKVEIEEA